MQCGFGMVFASRAHKRMRYHNGKKEKAHKYLILFPFSIELSQVPDFIVEKSFGFFEKIA